MLVLVGGFADGKRVKVSEHQSIVIVPEYGPIEYDFNNYETIQSKYQEHRYDIVTVAGSTRTFKVGVRPGMTGDELMKRLLEGYKP